MSFQRLIMAVVFPAILAGRSPCQPDLSANGDSLPKVPPGFAIKAYATEPLVRQPCSMAFDSKGRLFVGMGPQYRNPKPETPGDSVVLLGDANGDGVADSAKVFATGFNCIQGLAWHGRDLWVANSPDLTVVRDLDGDDTADEYVRIYTDLGNLEHGLHGLQWAPDGKLYMSKGNSKGLSRVGRVAPKPFRDLWGAKAPAGSPDFPPPEVFSKDAYRHAYHDPADDWGREGGVLRCDDGGANLEIISRGMRNPWDIATDDGFNWLGTDNDQNEGDRVIMPFRNAHFGWNHPWSSHWTDRPHPTCAPVSGPMFHGSGTGLTFLDSPAFPPEYRKVFMVNDWLRKTTFCWIPSWDGALMRPKDGTWKPFVEGGQSLFRPTDIEVGPDGAVWMLGWSRYYGAEYKNGQMVNEGRVFRVSWNGADPRAAHARRREDPRSGWPVDDLVRDFDGPLPVWRIDAADELVRRGAPVKAELMALLGTDQPTMRQTWTAWTLGRLSASDKGIDDYFAGLAAPGSRASLNLRIQAVRILGHRARHRGLEAGLHPVVAESLRSDEARLRLASVEAIGVLGRPDGLKPMTEMLAGEADRVVFYAGWQALRSLGGEAELRKLLADERPRVRRAALLALLESGSLKPAEVDFHAADNSHEVREIALLRLGKLGKADQQATRGPIPEAPGMSLVAGVKSASGRGYRVIPGGAAVGARVYSDRPYVLKELPAALAGSDLLQTANDDDGSKGEAFVTLEALAPVRIHVAIDKRQARPPKWVANHYRPTGLTIRSDDWTAALFSRDLPAGRVELGGNTDNGVAGGKANYIVFIEPISPQRLDKATTMADALAQLSSAEERKGALLFNRIAGCAKCHGLDQRRNSFGPHLGDIGLRADGRQVIESILDPDAHITEGFSQLVIESRDGKIHSGVLLEESGLSLTLGLSNAERLVIPKDRVESRTTTKKSAMPSFASHLDASQVACIAKFLLAQRSRPAEVALNNQPIQAGGPSPTIPDAVPSTGFGFSAKPDRLGIFHSGKPVGEFVFSDASIRRPFFSNLTGIAGAKITRNHPPIPGKDATDHDTMHPGLWLAFGDVSGVDFWRNRGRIRHLRFVDKPIAGNSTAAFATESDWVDAGGKPMGLMLNRFTLASRPSGWLIVWDATITAKETDLVFGDQEEMGFGARVATEFTEKKSGLIQNSHGVKSAGATWGKPAPWCDYSGLLDGKPVGVTLMASPGNFRESWWHNRDYGVFVANPFGRQAMKQGAKSAIKVPRGESIRLVFGAMLHDSAPHDPAAEYAHFVKSAK